MDKSRDRKLPFPHLGKKVEFHPSKVTAGDSAWVRSHGGDEQRVVDRGGGLAAGHRGIVAGRNGASRNKLPRAISAGEAAAIIRGPGGLATVRVRQACGKTGGGVRGEKAEAAEGGGGGASVGAVWDGIKVGVDRPRGREGSGNKQSGKGKQPQHLFFFRAL